MIFDSHCHPQMEQYDKDREEMLKRAREAGVLMICVGTDLETSKKGIELAQKNDGMWATVGLHPNDITDGFDVMAYHNMLLDSKVVAIGEVGLDYYRTPEPGKQKKQKEFFEQFIDLAQKTKKPLILHFRDSSKGSSGRVHKDAIKILDSRFKIQNSGLCGVAHSFTGNMDDAKKYLDLGFCLGFNGILTFTKQYDDVVKYIPLDRILLETDAPFLSPEPYRGKRNEPAYVVEVAKKIAELKNESLEKVIEQTTNNCKKLFKLV
ncbi:MAG: hypothetical protein A3B91_00455 [Candidatus Yanofskybacteria bacterium RIFCSPHIGHO2_02_FULL_41_29]|uniref:Hydrolase TatD n=1 Tax=Candidatus Yanofskybacteria bacterium RIFCSPHIGHO2_01_FULL_41_53 TaxID=1802663 RepID=A0A1F8EET7_9BACT|nr:MAG: hypothetical protein A2650_05080 [Candidatus Yanofskybacteria bacterium RIFCSPHIGHO2_01_FULL_41_53]OGN10452.1 MAG: hypothetical protein A3B91_00455 [Candidatus Yanofskybacteria bacterium RIFCSPHIGHO2_02_FULL_41_29]OGN17985.1 MAG: hypothetical protein A3F48_04780 [Candidatus Yanofskybacteria bacterium RIFCSPHIGHO2_12_FULL_41_9]OGN21400.1 MAG: hypothetical protein A2916_00015 [Candidatus Yanofskybacteria bacterium RIFCSPLOWO2_01_FULL_41_67]OGN29245.1 MAG: hypothetical protein A3H54_03670 